MRIPISRREVLNNLIRFKDNLLIKKEKDWEPFRDKRVYIALLNKHTGDIRFAQSIEILHRQPSASVEKGNPADWQEIHLIAENEGQTVHFRMTGPQGNSLKPTELDPLAVRILFETLDVLNQLATLYHPIPEKELPEDTVLQDLSNIHISAVQPSIQMMPGWAGGVDRIEAERKLQDLPQGSYLIRMADGPVQGLVQSLALANKTFIKLYVVTFVADEERMSERLLIETEWGWTVCRDDSDLASPVYHYYASLNSLLQSLSDQIKTPI